MKKFIRRPSIDLYPGIRVEADTELDFSNDRVQQQVKDLVLHSTVTMKGDTYESVLNTTVRLEVGDILLFEEDGRGWFKPAEPMASIEDAIDDLDAIKDLVC